MIVFRSETISNVKEPNNMVVFFGAVVFALATATFNLAMVDYPLRRLTLLIL